MHGRVRCGPSPGHFTAAAAVISPLGLGTWAHGHGRQGVAVGGGGGAGRGDRNAGFLEREKANDIVREAEIGSFECLAP